MKLCSDLQRCLIYCSPLSWYPVARANRRARARRSRARREVSHSLALMTCSYLCVGHPPLHHHHQHKIKRYIQSVTIITIIVKKRDC